MKEKLKAILGGCYQIAMILWTYLIGMYFVAVIYHIVKFTILAISHIVTRHNLQVGNPFPYWQKTIFNYSFITFVLLWRLTLDAGTLYRITNRFKIKWYQLLDDNNFVQRILSHFFVGIPEAPDLEKLPFPYKGGD